MALTENYYAVLLHGQRIGTLCQKGDYTRFMFNEDYVVDPSRPVLGLRFEENLRRPYASALRLPRWFSNLLPEGPLREWIAQDRDVALDREMELLAQVGSDLPGAVQVFPADGPDGSWQWPLGEIIPDPQQYSSSALSPWRFSLAGVALKFSMLARGDRLTVPAVGERGDWLVKFPDYRFPDVPRNEFCMMSLAREVGINTPDVRLIHRDELSGLPDRMWPNSEEWAYATRRFDRLPDVNRSTVHIEDLAQVRDKYPQNKYEGSFETVAALVYRGRDLGALQEFARRLAFGVMIGNGDSHLKNWSLIYADRRMPTLSPVYDLVSTMPYYESGEQREDLGLTFCGSRRFESVSLASFQILESRLDRRFGLTGANLTDVVASVRDKMSDAWSEHQEKLKDSPGLLSAVSAWLAKHNLS
ncbi:type II toxin-antitoxin system HipA family toxin [Actinomadura logoneensis]|uniref:Type II toxin-antitoxin system HipA family toxin n=1 Tax=Actinomadura logoneensis TaxID=2293572 RepID=A0A372JNR0_9ACTN|nr:type II toxin-antitoxin system HipA family toxin [Actinomadura logoneensis]RFU41436.1 type II toxin-antitoxin system HipA family toxin [Actinomadura logoneensis]